MTALAVFLVFVGFGIVGKVLAATTVNLGTANSFAVLAGSGITNTGATTITGDVGSFPTVTQTGFGSVTLNGTNHGGDGVTQGAKTDLVTAYNAAGQSADVTLPTAELGSSTRNAGVYDSLPGTLQITGTLTLDGQGDPNAVFIFKAASTLITASASRVVLINSAQACNVFWQVGSSATIGTTSDFAGNILAMDSITDDGGSTIAGRLLARNAAVTLNNTTVTAAKCAPRLTVTKTVVNDNGGIKSASDFSFFIDGVGVTSGVVNHTTAGLHTVTETSDSGYATTIGGDCAANGTITLALGDVKTCTITNNDIAAVPPASITVVKTVVNDNGGVKTLVDFPLFVNGAPVVSGVANVFAAPASYTVTETGDVGYTQSFSVDCDAGGIVALSPGDSKICIITNDDVIPPSSSGGSGTSIPLVSPVPPLIDVVKMPNPLALPLGPGPVTYTYVLTNTGTVPLSNVLLTDDKCAPVNYISGDINGDSKLDVNEIWTYTCTANLTRTTTNTAVATGMANNLTARDFAIATVVVAAPGFPNAGLPPTSKSSALDLLALSSLFLLILALRATGKQATVLA